MKPTSPPAESTTPSTQPSPSWLWRVNLAGLGILLPLAAQEFATAIHTSGFMAITLKWKIVLGVVTALGFGLLAIFGLSFTPFWHKINPLFERLAKLQRRLVYFNLLLALICAALPSWLIFGIPIYSNLLTSYLPRLALMWAAALVAAACLRAVFPSLRFSSALVGCVILCAGMLQGVDLFLKVNDYPFTQAWSETSRYYYGSLPFSQQVYGQAVPLSPWHASRYFMLSVPFAVQGLPLWAHRLWQQLLWLVFSLLTGWSLARRLPNRTRWLTLAVTTWGFLFMFIGPIYYHLQVCLIIVLLGFDLRHPRRTLLAVLLASIWAGFSRVNWVPVPAALAVALYCLEAPFEPKRPVLRHLWRYFARPVMWMVTGMAAALAAQFMYQPISGQPDLSLFGSSYTSALLWYRLTASHIFGPGILQSSLLLSVPLLLILLSAAIKYRRQAHWLRWAALGGILLVFWAGGMVVSTKVGGGSNLHNMDAYLALLAIIGVLVAGGRMQLQPSTPSAKPHRIPILLTALMPALWLLHTYLPAPTYNYTQAAEDLREVRAVVAQAAKQNQPVLFITQRHLVTFNMVQKAPFVPDYELLTLMEMAISGNQGYLNRYYADLSAHRFAWIISDRQNTPIKDPLRDAFAEENNDWVQRVVLPTLQHYQVSESLKSNIDILMPKP